MNGAALVSLLLAVQAVQPLTPDQTLLVIRSRNQELLEALPNCLCLESIRTESANGTAKEDPREDFGRVEIAVTSQGESYSLPGSGSSQTDLASLASSEFANIGMYHSLALGIASASSKNEVAIAEDEIDGEPVLGYRFLVPGSSRPWKISLNKWQGSAGEKGEYWVTKADYTLRRIVVDADPISKELPLKKLRLTVDYLSRTMNGRTVLLPSNAHAQYITSEGGRGESWILFNHCRMFGAESAISFEGSLPRAARELAKRKTIPGNLMIKTVLQNSLDARSVAEDRELRARVAEPVFYKGEEIIKAGDVLEGTVQRFRYLRGKDLYVVRVVFDRLHSKAGSTDFYASLTSIPNNSSVQFGIDGRIDDIDPNMPSMSTFYLRGRSSSLPSGAVLIWKTREYKPDMRIHSGSNQWGVR